MVHVFKRSHNAHIMLFFDHFTVYAYRTSEKSLVKQNTWNFISRKETISEMEWLDLLSIPGCLPTLKSGPMLKIIEYFFDLCIPALCGWMRFEKFHYTFFGRWFCSCVIFKMADQVQNVAKCKYLFPSILP